MSLSSNFPTSKPSLNLDFANVGALDPRITFTRSSSATYTNSLGLITTAATNVARFDYDPVTLAARGLLVEEQRTNLLTYSEQFDNAAWLKLNASVTANTSTAPDGTSNADKLVENNQFTNHTIYQAGVTTTTATLSVYAKAAERSNLIVRQYQADGEVVSANFDLSAGTVSKTLNQGTTFTSPSYSITSVGNGWYRCTITATRSSGTTIPAFDLSNTNNPTFRSGGDCEYQGDGSSGLLLWGAQLESSASFASSYIPTPTNSTVTRSADVASVDTLSPWFNATEGTLYAEASSQGTTTTTTAASLNDGTDNNFIGALRVWNTNTGRLQVLTAGALQAEFDFASTFSNGTTAKLAIAFKANDFAGSVSGQAALTDTSGSIPTVSTLSLGALPNNNRFLNGHIRRIAFYPVRLTNAQLQALTS